jgi:spore maturation protein CgeB
MTRKLKIAFFGSSIVSAYWNGAATYYRGIVRALAEHGHAVTFFEPAIYDRQKHRDIEDPGWAKVVIYDAGTEDQVMKVVESARDFDVLVKTSGVGAWDELLEAAVLDIARPGAVKIFWDVDAPATLNRVHENAADPFTPLISRYDLILTYGGGDPVVTAYEALGARQCVPIYNALDTSTHHPVARESRFSADLGLLANRLPDREKRVEEFFLNVAERLPERKFMLGGNGWGDKPMPGNVEYLGHVYTNDHNAFNSSPLAVLNVNRDSMAEYGFSPPTRVFEAAGAGACLITDAWEGIELFLEPGREVLVAGDGQEVAEHLAGLDHATAREMGRRALTRMLSEHTYAHRVVELEEILQVNAQTASA